MSTIFSDLFSTAKTISVSEPRSGIGRAVYHELISMRNMLGDPSYEAVGLSASTSDEIQRILQLDSNPATPATYVLTFSIDGVSYSTTAIPVASVFGTVQTAVDVALATVPGYVAGHVAVTGSAVTAGNLTLTFSGASVSDQNVGQTTIAVTGTILASPSSSTTVAGTTGVDEVQKILTAANDATGGTFTLTLTVNSQAAFTTAPIAYSAINSAVQTAINTAATLAATPTWVNDSVVVTGGPLNSADFTLTYSGDAVDETNQAQATIDGTLLTNNVEYRETVSSDTTTAGTALRPALATLKICGIIDTIPAGQGDSPSGVGLALGFQTGVNPNRLSNDTLRALAIQAEIEEERPGLAEELYTIFGISA